MDRSTESQAELDALLKKHAVILGERFDSIVIIATHTNGETRRHICSHGSEYASLAALEETYLKSSPSDKKASDDDEDEGDKWRRTSSSIIQ